MSGQFDPKTKHFAVLHVLIVDDQFTMRELLSSICVSIGFQHITSCDTGKEAMRQLQAGKFDLVIVDEKLQGESGLQVVRAIRGIPALASVLVLLVTASRDHEIAMSAKKAGSNDFMLKPFTPEALKERLLRLLPDHLGSGVVTG